MEDDYDPASTGMRTQLRHLREGIERHERDKAGLGEDSDPASTGMRTQLRHLKKAEHELNNKKKLEDGYGDFIYVNKIENHPDIYTIIEKDNQRGLRISRINSKSQKILSEIYINNSGEFSSNNPLESFIEDLGY